MDEPVTGGDNSGAQSGTGGSSPTATLDSGESASPDTIDSGTESTQQAQSTPGPVAYERFKQVNDGYSKLRWAESYQPDQVQQQAQFFQWLQQEDRKSVV